MSHVFHRDPRLKYPVAVRGEGAYLIDRDGKRYLDASGGAAVSCLGHRDPAVVARDPARRLEKLALRAHVVLHQRADGGARRRADRARAARDRATRCTSSRGGSEAIEAALKLARQYFVENGEPQRAPRHRAAPELSRQHARRARGRRQRLAAQAVRAAADRRRHVSPCYAYRGKQPGETRRRVRRAPGATSWKQRSSSSAPKSVIAFVAETVVGATLGAVPPVPGYFKRVREVCDRHGVLLILDEVMCGMGRMRHAVRLRAGRHRAGPRGGRQGPRRRLPADRRAARRAGKVVRRDREGQRLLPARPYLHRPRGRLRGARSRCSSVIARDGLLARVQRSGRRRSKRGCAQRFGEHPHVGDIRGRGLFWGVELVEDRATQEAVRPGAAHARARQARGDGSAG